MGSRESREERTPDARLSVSRALAGRLLSLACSRPLAAPSGAPTAARGGARGARGVGRAPWLRRSALMVDL